MGETSLEKVANTQRALCEQRVCLVHPWALRYLNNGLICVIIEPDYSSWKEIGAFGKWLFNANLNESRGCLPPLGHFVLQCKSCKLQGSFP